MNTMLKLILDTNLVIAALINKYSTIRDLLRSTQIQFYCPQHMIEEIEKYKEYILQKSSLTENEFYFTLYYLLEKVTVVQKECFGENMLEAKEKMEKIDVKDAPFLALALSLPNDGILSNDPHFDKVGLRRWSVKEILTLLRL